MTLHENTTFFFLFSFLKHKNGTMFFHPSACLGDPSVSVHNSSTLFFLTAAEHPIVYRERCPTDGLLGCFQFFPVVSSAAMRTFV